MNLQALFNDLSLALSQQISDRDEYRQRVADWAKKGATYMPQAIKQRQDEEYAVYEVHVRKNVAQLIEAIQKLKAEAVRQSGTWATLDSTKLANALKIIEMSNPLDPLVLRTMRTELAGDIASFRLLKGILEKKIDQLEMNDASSALIGEINALDEMIYDPETAFDKLLEDATLAVYTGKSLHTFIKEINRIAGIHGVSGMDLKMDKTGNAFDFINPSSNEPVHPDLLKENEFIEEAEPYEEDEDTFANDALNAAFGLK